MFFNHTRYGFYSHVPDVAMKGGSSFVTDFLQLKNTDVPMGTSVFWATLKPAEAKVGPV